MAKNNLRTQVGHKSVHGLWQPSKATRSAPSKDSPSSMHSVLKDREWCIYGIIYHYAPFFAQQSNVDTFRTQLRNSKSSPKSIIIFKEGLFSYSVWQFPGGYQKTIQGPQPPVPADFGLSFTQFSDVINFFNNCQGIKYSAFLGQLNWSIQVVIKHPVCPWPNWAN
ncbi:hypothetical protein O181_007265 [Austropuccinia psidii MF-1]|uniref:Uncharacterized protein n=1 Tax=Austropuccinia psidii MF-1 TaxID=1389203 RepID=A0A9Q3BML1_9BASI|nr:hypothetical protein [Austropuccinia psidii MF-1]